MRLDTEADPIIYKAVSSIRLNGMALSLKDKETDRLARQVSSLTGETLTEAIRTSLRERLRNEQLRRGGGPELAKALEDIARRCAALPVLDHRSDDDILGYDANGIPG